MGAIKWHGGKAYLASRIIGMFPPHTHYCEPYFGGGAVIFARDPVGVSEVVNDINSGLVNFWKVLRDPELFPAFRRACEATPFSEELFRESSAALDYWDGAREDKNPVSWAYSFFVTCRLSMAGRMKSFSPVTRTRTRRGMNNEVSAWLSAVEGLPAVHERLKRVLILNRDALNVIGGQDGEKTLFYVDAPYVLETRTAPKVYTHEMSDDQHRQLIECLRTIKGKAIVSMYRHPIYDILHLKYGWRIVEFDIPNHAASGSTKRRMNECLWTNFR